RHCTRHLCSVCAVLLFVAFTFFISPFLICFSRKHLAFVNPNLYTDFSVSCVSFCESIINVSSQCLQRNCTLAVELCTGHISAAKTSGYGSLNSECACLHCS